MTSFSGLIDPLPGNAQRYSLQIMCWLKNLMCKKNHAVVDFGYLVSKKACIALAGSVKASPIYANADVMQLLGNFDETR